MNRLKNAILLIALAVVFLPLLLGSLGVRLSDIHRIEMASQPEELSFQNWFSGAFQESAQRFLNDNIGLFAVFVRVHNQVEYSLFNQAHTGNVIAGKNHYLFDKPYLDAQEDDAFIGLKRINKRVNLLKAAQDTLAKKDKFLMVCLAANKPSYYREYLPYAITADSTNKFYFQRAFDKAGINYLDCDRWFLKMKDTLGDFLFPKYGIHWSHYSAMLVADSLAGFIAYHKGWDLPRMQLTKKVVYNETRFYDNDIANTMNLFWEPQPDSMVYPDFEWIQPKGKPANKKVLIIGDSFAMSLVEESGLGTDCFSDLRFWYYNQTVRKPGAHKGAMFSGDLPDLVRHLDFNEQIEQHDAIIILTNEPNMPALGWGFLLDVTHGLEKPHFRAGSYRTENLKNQCKLVESWRQELTAQAEARGISLDKMIDIYVSDPAYNLEEERILKP